MKKLMTLAVMLFAALQIFAQSPDKFNYQAVCRNSSGGIIASQAVSLRMTIHDLTATGSVLYQETHSVTTNTFGLVNIEVGNGTVVSGTFATIPWGTGAKYMEVELDPAGGSAYTSIGTPQLLSVPYALYANTSGTGGATGPTGANGATGAMGPTGSAGANGAPGAMGATGPAGATGAMGPVGTTGAAGTTGADGTTGAMGPIGPSGAAGTTGVDGATGAMGPIGPTGAAGTTGADGATGSIGLTGATGADGVTGPIGLTGVTGFLSSGTAAGNTPYWDGTTWVLNSSNIYNNGGNVGIGTTSPGAKFQVNGNATIDNTAGISTLTIGSTSGATPKLTFGGTSGGIIQTTQNTLSMRFGSGASYYTVDFEPAKVTFRTGGFAGYERLTIFSDGTVGIGGNVGIGTTTPAFKLDVAGGSIRTDNQFISTLAIGTSPFAVTSTTLNTNLNADLLDGLHATSFLSSAAGTANYVAKFSGANAIANSQIFDNGTNVGIGTNLPTSILHVKGTADPLQIMLENTGGNFKTGFGLKTALQEWFIGQQGVSTTGFRIVDVTNLNAVRLQIETTTGNVGIGTATPGAKLEVAGQVKITGGTPGAGKVLTSDAAGLATWQVPSGGSSTHAVTSTSNYTIQAGDNVLISNDASVITYTLPSAAVAGSGAVLYFYGMFNSISITTSQTIRDVNGITQTTLSGKYIYILASDGVNKWFQIQ